MMSVPKPRIIRAATTGACTVAGLFGLAVANMSLAQHVHGEIELGIVVEDDTVSVALHAPLSDVLGFEHAAENEEQAERIHAAADLIKSADRMFGLPEAAGCDIQDVDLDGPDYLFADDDDGHVAGHAHEDDHDDHEDDHSDTHSHGELDAQYIWQCADAGAVDELEARFVAGFENVETINIQIITPTGVRVLEGDSQLDSISVSDP